jgi:NAD(P)-dependent dehydrogenase (short-subunit alcohol dehydrogenase family)
MHMAKGWLLNKRIVIIGGTDGLGLSAALACIEEGANVVAVGNNPAREEEVNSQFEKKGAAITGDAREEAVAEKAIQACVDRYGGFDGLYHVAGGSGRKFGDSPIHEMTAAGWHQTIELNLTSLMFSNRAALNFFMKYKQGGAILNMGSVLGFSPSPKYFTTHAYAACKSAVIGLSKSVAAYYGQYNIRVNVIAPGLVKTPMSQRAVESEDIMQFIQTKQPLDGGRIGIPEDMDGAAIFLLSDHAKFITGQVIAVDGGWTVTEGQY